MTIFSDISADVPFQSSAKIQRHFLDCEQTLGVFLTVHDHLGFFRDEKDRPLLTGRHIHRHPFCQLQRKATVMRCVEHCEKKVHEHGARRRRPFCTSCWKGLREIVVPLLHEDTHIATLYCGTWRPESARPPRQEMIRRRQVREAYHRIALWRPDDAKALTGQLQLWAEGLIQSVLKLRFAASPDNRAAQIRMFIGRWAHRPLSLADLADHLHLSPSRTGHVVRQWCGRSFGQLLTSERIARAKVLLQASSYRLTRIAQQCGFSDLPYFSRMFKRETGMTPGAWRKQHGQTPRTVCRS